MKKMVASLLSIIMFVFACGPVGLAYDFSNGVLTSGTTESDMPTLQAVYMKRNAAAAAGTCKFEEDTIGSLKAGDDFYVGLRGENFSHFSGISKGLYSIAGGIAYNTDYIEPYEYYEDAPTEIITDDDEFKGVLDDRMLNDAGSNSFYNNGVTRTSKYTVVSGAMAKENSSGYNTNIGANIKIVQFGIQFSSTTKSPLQFNDGDYVAFLHFRVKATPSSPEKVMTISNATEVCVQFGIANSATEFEDYSYSATSKLEDYLKLDDSKIDLFPASYSVKFYTDNTYGTELTSKVGTTLGATGITSGTAYTDAGVVVPTAGTDFDLVNSDNKYFAGFKYVDSTGTEHDLADLTTINESAVANGYSDYVIKVYPVYETGHDVTFNSNYPTGTQTTKVVTVSPSAGATIAKSQKPTVGVAGSGSDFEAPAGYTFKGWFTQANGGDEIVFDDGTNTSSATDVSAISDVYAQWTQSLTVTFHENNGPTDNTTQKTVDKDASLTDSDIPTFTRANYTFAGWNTKANGSGTSYTNDDLKALTVSADADYYAMWEPTDKNNQVTLTFDSTGCDGAVSPASITVVKGDTIYAYQMPTDPTKTSATGDKYTFEGWYEGLSQSNADKFNAPFELNENKTAYAHWSYDGRDKVTVTFDYDGAKEPTVPTSISLGKGDAVGDAMPTNPVKDNYSFNKWVNTADNSDFDKNTVVNADVTVKATYSSFITVKYNVNGGTGTYADVVGAPTEAYADPAQNPTKVNYVFIGWNTEPNGSGKFIKAADCATLNDVSLAAQGSATTAPTTVTLYAYWADANVTPGGGEIPNVTPNNDGVKVTFNSNVAGNKTNATVTDANPKYVYPHLGDSLGNMMPTAPTRTHYKFVGWNTKADGTGTTFTNATAITAGLDGVTANGDKYSLVVYAQWDIDENVPASDRVTLTFNDNNDGNGGTQVKTVTIFKGDALGYDITAPTNTGYSFDDWYEGTVTGGSLSMTTNKFNKDAKINSNTDYYAKWTSNITIKYDVNGGTGTYADVVGAPTEAYADPAQNPTKANYVFIGWNTEPNGSGKFIKAADCATLNDVSLAAQGSATTAPTTVTLYAYWADTNVTPGGGEIPNVTPNNDGVKVIFNSNVAGNKTNATVTDANPKYVYPHLGDSLGNMMPTAPTRTHYVFKGWSTTPSGKGGVTVDASTAINQNTLGDALQAIPATNTAYEVTLYAQWDTDDTANKVTVTFKANKNLDGTTSAGDPDANDIVINLNSGDSIGYDLPTITNGTFDFEGWNTSIDGKGTAFDKDAEVTADTTYYAYWFKWLKIDLVNNKAEYTGKVIAPKYNIYQVDKDDKTTKVGSNIVDNGDLPAGFTAAITDNDNNSATIQNVGVYTIAISIDSSGTYARNYKIATNDSTFEVTPAKLTVNVDPATQKQKAGSTRKDPDITVVDVSGNTVGTGEYNVKYYTWTDAGTVPDGKIQKNELSEVTDITKVGKYVVAVELNANSNYVIDSVKSTTTESVALYDGKTTGYVDYTDAKVGQNIVYEVVANDPSIKAITANSVTGTTVDSNNLPFKDSKFENDVTFDNAESPAIKDYYVRVPDVDADNIQFNVTLTNPETTTITASDGTTLTPTKNSDGTYTIKAPLTNKGQTENTITITTKAGTDADAPTLTYTFHVQQLVTPKITLNYGNSPVGEIMKADNIAAADKLDAISKFSDKNTFKNIDSKYVPTNANTKNAYTLNAWNGETDSDKNMDRNPYAIFVYEQSELKDTGFEAYDSLGNKVADADVTRTITVSRYKTSNGINAAVEDETKVYGKNATDTSLATITANDAVLTGITSNGLQFIRPDVYTMTYEFNDIDGSKVTEERKIVVVPLLGDTNIDGSRNTNDITFVKLQAQGSNVVNSTVPTSAANLFIWRVFDGNFDTAINSNDITYVKLSAQGKYLDPFYNEIK